MFPLTSGKFKNHVVWLTIYGLVLTLLVQSCKSDQYGSHWFDEHSLTICQYLDKNQDEYSKSFALLAKGKMLSPLCGYNPYGDGYTLFLPTNEAIERFIDQNNAYEDFEALLKDTAFVYYLARYHTLKRKLHTNEFPDGALTDSTLTGERLAIGWHSDGENQLIKINNVVPIVKSNLEMTNGFIHVVSEVLQPVKISGYEFLQQHEGYTILAKAMEIAKIRNSLWWSKYTLLAEHDSIYRKNGINTVEDLIRRVATPGVSYSSRYNNFYRFAAFHVLGGEYYLNDFYWGDNNYATMASKPLTISVGSEIKINPGIDTYGILITGAGDTAILNYIRPVWENSNVMSASGPVHSITDLLFFEPIPD